MDLCDVTACRRVYENDDKYLYEGVTIICGESHRGTPEIVRFTLQFPIEFFGVTMKGASLNVPFADFCLREFIKRIESIELSQEHQTGKVKYTGRIYIHKPNRLVLLRNTAFVADGSLNIMLRIQFPVHMMEKRNVIAGKLSVRIVKKFLARAIRDFISDFDGKACRRALKLYERQQELRGVIEERGLVSFVANGSILPRDKEGNPLESATPFVSPEEDEVSITLSDGFILKGLGVKKGVTVITGGGYSGKSTLLDSILEGIYNHSGGDGREYCITQSNCCKIVAEEGRNITSLDISAFIRHIHNNDTKRFSTTHASGSTSQAANIMEAIAFGCRVLLVDEDRTATNFMIRDARMKSLIRYDPIIPFTDRVREIYDKTGTSTILVIGGSSEYLDLADTVYVMNEYKLTNFNDEINRTRQHAFDFFNAGDEAPAQWVLARRVLKKTLNSFKKDLDTNRIREHISIDERRIMVGELIANVSYLDTVMTEQQITAIAFLIRQLCVAEGEPTIDLMQLVNQMYQKIRRQGLEGIYSSSFPVPPDMELPMLHDVLFAISRIGKLEYGL